MKDLGERPPCPTCKSTRIKSAGISWRCKDCGKEWIKKPHPQKLIQRPDHPCPECGSTHIQSQGVKWVCCECAKTFQKILRKTNFAPSYENLPLKIEEEKIIES
jgi:ribosomal protein L37AE/L43A